MKKIVPLFLFPLLTLPFFAFAASPTISGTVRKILDDTLATSHTFSINLDATGQNQLLHVLVEGEGSGAFSDGATWDGVAMTYTTAVGTCIAGGHLFTLAAPHTGTHNLVINSSLASRVNAFVFVTKDTAQTSYFDHALAHASGGNGGSCNLVTTASTPSITSANTSFNVGWLFISLLISTGVTNTNGTALTATQQNGYDGINFGSYMPATGGADSLSYSWTNARTWDSYTYSVKYQAPDEGGGTASSTMPACGPSLQNQTFTYDPVGNITNLTECSNTGTAKMVSFAYDDLHRLTFASTTVASSTPFLHSFAYDWLGNITGMNTNSATTTYTYAGTGKANPHAPTSIGASTQTYDDNGNLTAAGDDSYQWDYRNRLTQATHNSNTSTYTYDDQNNRMTQVAAGVTTKYPNKYVSVTGASTTDYIYIPGLPGGDVLAAAVEASGVATTTRYMHPDHLGSTNVVTSATGSPIEALDYYPYGSSRIASSSSSQDEKHKYIGQYYDNATALNYLNARYLSNTKGNFISEDPVFLAVGNPSQLQQLSKQDQQRFLMDPQQMNSYSYGRDNPVTNKDPQGTFIVPAIVAVLEVYGYAQSYVDYLNFNTVTTYPEQFTETQVNSAGNQLLQDIWSGGITGAATNFEKIVIGSGGAVLNVYDSYCGNHTCRNFGKPGDPTIEEIFNKPKASSPSSPQGTAPNSSNNQNGNNKTQTQRQGQSNYSSVQHQIADIRKQIKAIQDKINSFQQQSKAPQTRNK